VRQRVDRKMRLTLVAGTMVGVRWLRIDTL
jgi:hypothetical protein